MRYEFKVVVPPHISNVSKYEDTLNRQGRDGWRLSHVKGSYYCFYREIEEEASPVSQEIDLEYTVDPLTNLGQDKMTTGIEKSSSTLHTDPINQSLRARLNEAEDILESLGYLNPGYLPSLDTWKDLRTRVHEYQRTYHKLEE